MSDVVQVIWFKRDLRVHDHAPLLNASHNGPVIPLYIIEPTLWAQPDSSRRHWHFIHDSLHDLRDDLAARGAQLIIRIGEVCDVLDHLRQQFGSFVLWSHEETGNGWSYQRDLSVGQWCKAHGVIWHEMPSNGVVRRLKNRDEWARLRNQRMQAPLISAPTQIRCVAHVATHDLPAKDHILFGAFDIGSVQKGGRQEGVKTLASFLRERGRRYMLTISKPGVSARHCSRLSAHISFGTLSVREIEQATQAKITQLAASSEDEAQFFRRNLAAFLSRLAWHCHFIQKLEQQPSIEFKCMHSAFEGMREPYFRDDYFDAWRKGRTGYPLIDASMRSLHANGWITFRMRAMLVSFASYHLWLDWRRTAPFLAQLFTDYEPGIHYPQFQMQSGVTGINVLRMYNPIKQSYDHDPAARFIRRYLPELAGVPDAFVHEPWRCERPVADYPSPIVAHEAAVRHARQEIAQRWQQSDFKEQAKEVHQRLGSRQRGPRPKRSSVKQIQQLSFDV